MSLLRRTALLLATVVAALPLRAQQPAGAGAVTIGTVFDSIRGRPLAGAKVRLDSTDLFAVADAEGKFRLEGIPPGQHFLRVEHPMIDTLGITLRSGVFAYNSGESKVAELALPTAEGLVERLCTAAWRARGPAALMGRVREADTNVPAAGAKVSLLWFEIGPNLRRTPRVREATVGPDGSYRICGLPAQLDGKAQVIRGALTSGDVPVSFGEDLLHLRSISIAAEHAVVAAAPEPTDSARATPLLLGTARLAGRVLDRANRPIVGARVQVDGTPRAADTRTDGGFSIDSLPPGTQTVTTRKLGYAITETVVDLSSREPRNVTISMDDFVPVLETVRVNAQRERALDDVGYQRRKRIGTGWHIDGPELTNQTHVLFSDVLRTAPGIRVDRYGDKHVLRSSRDPNGCVVVYVDGTQWTSMTPGDIDEYVRPWEIGAIEVYSGTTTPAEFSGANRGNCATVVVWTQRRLDRRK